MRRFISKILLFAIPFLIVLVGVNYFGDAARLFSNDYEKKMAKIIEGGNYITNFGNYDERLCQKEFIELKTVHPKTIILGSSRTMLINSNNFPADTPLFNNSVSGASIEDLIAIYQIYKENNKLPKKIIIGIDSWIFNDLSDQKRWLSIEQYYNKFLHVESKEYFQTFKYKELISLTYFQSSVKLIPRFLSGKLDPQPAKITPNVSATKLTDGSLVYDKLFREASQKEIDDRIATYLAADLYSIENFKMISEKSWDLFQQLINELRQKQIVIEFFFSPYPPLVYNRVEKSYPMVLRTESIVKEFAKLNNIKVYGSFSPYILGMDKTHFYDGMHPKEIGIKTILNRESGL